MNLDTPSSISLLRLSAAIVIGLIVSVGALPAQEEFDSELVYRMQTAMDNGCLARGTMGISVAIISPRRGSWQAVSGYSHPAGTLYPGMLFGMGSITKTFTAAAIMQMVGEGKLTLDDRVVRWLPPMTNVDTNITIRQMLAHTSGIFNYTTSNGFWAYTNADLDRYITPEEILQFVGARRFAPGASWEYSNTNYLLLGMIIETISGTDYESEIRRRFIEPLGLQSTAMGANDELPGEVAHNWADFTGDNVDDDITAYPRRAIYSGAWAAGGLYSTAENLARWARALYGGEVLSPALLTQMTTFRNLSGGRGYGLGAMRQNVGGRTMWGHTGAIIGYYSTMLYNPQDSTAFVALINENGLAAEQILEQVVIEYYRTSSVRDGAGIVALAGSHPNPFTTATTISYRLERPADVLVRIYSTTGELVRVLDNGRRESGSHAIEWDGLNGAGDQVASGVYFCRVGNATGSMVSVVKR